MIRFIKISFLLALFTLSTKIYGHREKKMSMDLEITYCLRILRPKFFPSENLDLVGHVAPAVPAKKTEKSKMKTS